LRSNQVNINLVKALRINFIGTFTSNFLPGVAGGDIVRPIYLFSEFTDNKFFLYASVFFERVCGVIAVVTLAILGSLWVGFIYRVWLYIFISIAIIFGIVIALLFLKWISLPHKPCSGFIGKIQKVSFQFAEKFIGVAKNKRLFIETVIWSLISQNITVLMYWFLLFSLGIKISFLLVVMALSLAWLVAMIPISFNGLGLRESSIVYIFSRFAVPSSAATIVTILGLIPIWTVSIIGAILSTNKTKFNKE
jgi:uncharacterized protein (TIRG00374 family)